LTFFLDTDICIYFLKGKYKGIMNKLKTLHHSEIKIPSIVKAELLFGAEKSIKKNENKKKLQKFLAPYQIISFDDSASQIYAMVRADLEKKGKMIGHNDLIITSTVIANNGILVTNNQKEFSRIKKIKTENWIEF